MTNPIIKIIHVLLFTFILSGLMSANIFTQHGDHSAVVSPYAGQVNQDIKSLSQDEIEGLLAGTGTPFGGIAKPAELNGFPGPRHVLDAHKAGQFELTEEQLNKITKLFVEMENKAQQLGKKLIAIEKKMDQAFKDKKIDSDLLNEMVKKSAELYGQLRFVHLNTHLRMMEVLSEDQIALYNKLRGYTESMSNPCENIPKGHDPELWKKHNGCE